MDTSKHSTTEPTNNRAYPIVLGVRLDPEQSQGLARMAKAHGIKVGQMARVLISLAVHDMERAHKA